MLSAVLTLVGLFSLTIGGLLPLMRRAESSAYWLTYDSASPVVIHRRLPDGHIRNIALDSARNVELWDWSPDGRWLLYSDDSGRGHNLFRVHISGTPIQQLTDMPAFLSEASYSPNGEWIVFMGRASNSAGVYRIPANGGELQRLTEPGLEGHAPVWSPDGEWIAFYAPDAGQHWLIYRMRADGSGLEHLYTSGPQPQPILTWLSDGEWIGFTGKRANLDTVYRIRPNGSGLQVQSGVNGDNTWTAFADGKWRVYFSKYRLGNDIFHHNLVEVPASANSFPLQMIVSVEFQNILLSASPDSAWLLTLNRGPSLGCHQSSAVYLLSTDRSHRQCISPPVRLIIGAAIWSPLIDLPFRAGMVFAVGGLVMLAGVFVRK